jgi:hypothetical protein
MNTTTGQALKEEFDTFTAQSVNPSDFIPMPDVQVHNPVSETQPLQTDEKPVVLLRTKSIQQFFLPDVSWEGVVLDVLEDSFTARLVDIDEPSQYEEAEILNTSVSDQSDLDLIKPGAIFFWSIGRRVEGRRSEQVSLIQFRRLPVWTETEIKKAKQETTEVLKELGW